MHDPGLARSILRRELVARRQTLDASTKKHLDDALAQHLAAFLVERFGPLHALAVGAYWPMAGEPDLSALYDCFGQLGLPKVVARAAPLQFHAYRRGDTLVSADFGVRVPALAQPLQPALLIVPCIGFHVGPQGRIDRLGYGGGFYDRTLAASSLPAIGVCYASGALDAFAIEPHDMPLCAVVTERGVIAPGAAQGRP